MVDVSTDTGIPYHIVHSSNSKGLEEISCDHGRYDIGKILKEMVNHGAVCIVSPFGGRGYSPLQRGKLTSITPC